METTVISTRGETPKENPTAVKNSPLHLAIIMDGNGRWAQARGLPRSAGHQAGMENIRRVTRAAVEFGIPYLTLYAFSTENWGRPKAEVSAILALLSRALDRELPELHRQGVRLLHLGRLDRLNPKLQARVVQALDLTRANRRLTLNLAFDYGGRDELMHAIRQMLREGLSPDEIREQDVQQRLYTAGQPDPDLIIRTGGELRLSNFLLWQAAYAEYLATELYWPDFDAQALKQALDQYAGRKRRFGRLEAY
jgi:undecaprenyl diphosphate synthase